MLPFYEKKRSSVQIGPTAFDSFPAHLHSEVELLFVSEGTASVEIKDKTYTLHKGECILIFPEQVHRYPHNVTQARGVMAIFPTSSAGPFQRYFQKYRPENPMLAANALPSDVPLAIGRLLSDTVQNDSLLCSAWIQVLSANLLPLLFLRKNNESEEPDLTPRIIRYVMEHFQEPLTLDILAKELHVNKYYLSHTMSDRLQMNFREYLNELRLDYAIQLMHSPDLTLTRIWGEAGFESQTSFNRIFRAKKNDTPGVPEPYPVNRGFG